MLCLRSERERRIEIQGWMDLVEELVVKDK